MQEDATIEARVERAVARSLRAITRESGYHVTPAVGLGDGPPPPVGSATVYVKTDAATAATSADITRREYSVVVTLSCWVPPPGGADGVRRVLDLVSDIRRRLQDDRSLDGSVLEFEELEGDDADDALVRGDGSARLSYRARVVTIADETKEAP